MAVAKMKKVTLLGHCSVKPELTRRLQERGLIQIVSARDEAEGATPERLAAQIHDLELAIHKANFMLGFLGGFAMEKRSFIRSMMTPRVYVTRAHYEMIEGKIPFEELYERCEELDDELAAQRGRRGRLSAQAESLRPWIDLDAPLSAREGTIGTALLLGFVPAASIEAVKAELAEAADLADLEVVDETGQQVSCAVIVHSSAADEVQGLLARFGFKAAPIDAGLEQRPRAELDRIESELTELSAKEKETHERAVRLTALLDDILVLRERLQDNHDRAAVEERFYHTDQAFLIEGWARASDLPAITEVAGELAPAIEVAATDPEPGDSPPVELDNPRIFKPFEALMRLYGYPSHDELDPTVIMGPFFFIFFGMALGDAGYGLVLALACWWGIRHFDLQGNVKNFMHLLMYGGIGSILVGVLTGGYFGIDARELPQVLRSIMLIDPLNQAMEFMIIAIMLGIVQVILGVILEGVDAARHGDWATAIFDQGTTVAMLVTAILSFVGWITLTVAGKLPPALEAIYGPALMGLGLSAALLVLLQGRVHEGFGPALAAIRGSNEEDVAARGRAKVLADGVLGLGLLLAVYAWVATFFVLGAARGIAGQALLVLAIAGLIGSPIARSSLGRVGSGVFNLYGMSGFIGDFLSYARLMAIGLATVLIGMVINLLAKMVFPAPYVGLIFGVLLLIVGHTFNLVINLLGAFVHPTRLQFVEFFSKFYDDGGEEFAPLAIRTKHLIFVPEKG